MTSADVQVGRGDRGGEGGRDPVGVAAGPVVDEEVGILRVGLGERRLGVLAEVVVDQRGAVLADEGLARVRELEAAGVEDVEVLAVETGVEVVDLRDPVRLGHRVDVAERVLQRGVLGTTDDEGELAGLLQQVLEALEGGGLEHRPGGDGCVLGVEPVDRRTLGRGRYGGRGRRCGLTGGRRRQRAGEGGADGQGQRWLEGAEHPAYVAWSGHGCFPVLE